MGRFLDPVVGRRPYRMLGLLWTAMDPYSSKQLGLCAAKKIRRRSPLGRLWTKIRRRLDAYGRLGCTSSIAQLRLRID